MNRYCSACGGFHESTTGACHGPWQTSTTGHLVGSVVFSPAVTRPPGIDTGVIHRGPLLAKTEALEKELRDLREAARAYRELASRHNVVARDFRMAGERYNRNASKANKDAASAAMDRLTQVERELRVADACLAALLSAPEVTP